jgi:5-formyltetrahydrofolate cyclo-ligase
MNKVELRRSLLAQRTALSPQDWQEKSLQICQRLQEFPLFQQAKTILAYHSIRQEPDISSLFELSKHWGFPRCVGRSLTWHYWSPTDALPLQTGRYGVIEPHPGAPIVTPEQVDLILIPAIACDAQGYRLGYGAGFYDRLLGDRPWQMIPTIGITFEAMRLPSLPHDDWDQPLQMICTEQGLLMAA